MFYRLIFSALLLCVSALAWGQITSDADGITTIKNPDEDARAVSVVLSNDGQTLLNTVGSGGGAVRVYGRTVTGGWELRQTLEASNVDADDNFGNSLAISDDGNTIIVGSSREDSAATGVSSTASTDNDVRSAGAVYVFTRDGTEWQETAYLKASNTGAVDLFGGSLAISGDGERIAVGAVFEDSSQTTVSVEASTNNGTVNSGAVYVYVFSRNEGSWQQEAYFKAPNADSGDEFGAAVALNEDGTVLAVGTPGEDSLNPDDPSDNYDPLFSNNAANIGAVYVFKRSNAMGWSGDSAYLKSIDLADNSIDTGISPRFGESLSLSGDGLALAVGVIGERQRRGAAYVFRDTGEEWVVESGRLTALYASGGDLLGTSVDLSHDGRFLAVAARDEASTITGVYALDDSDFISDGSHNSGSDIGIVYVYELNPFVNLWEPIAVVKPSELPNFSSSTGNGLYGSSVSWGGTGDGRYLAIGAVLPDRLVDVIPASALPRTIYIHPPSSLFLSIGDTADVSVALSLAVPTDRYPITVSVTADDNLMVTPSSFELTNEESLAEFTITTADGLSITTTMTQTVQFTADGDGDITGTLDVTIGPPIGLEVMPSGLNLYRLSTTPISVSVNEAAVITVDATDGVGLAATEYRLGTNSMFDIPLTGIEEGQATITLTARGLGLVSETVEVSVMVLESLEVLSSPREIHLRADERQEIEVSLNRIASEIGDVTVSLGLSRDDDRISFNPPTLLFTDMDAGTKTVTVIAGADYIDYEVNVILLDADDGNYIDTTVDIQPSIGLEVIPRMVTLYQFNTAQVEVSVINAATVTVEATEGIRLEETEYELAAGGMVDLIFTGVAEGPATITLTAQTQLPAVRDEVIEVSVEVRESLEVLVNPPQIDLLTGEPVEIEVSLNRIAPEIGPVTVTLTLTGGGEEISISSPTLLFKQPGTQRVTITGSRFAPYNEIVFDADNENYVDAIVRVNGAFNRLSGDANDRFGHQVAISANGQTLVVGEHLSEDGVPNNAGLVHVYTKDTLGLWVLRQTLKASNAGGGDQFGCSLAIDNDGETIAVGACGEDSSQTGVSTAASNNNGSSNSGAAYVFVNNDEEWIEEAYFKASNPTSDARFGHSVALNRDGRFLLVGAPSADGIHIGTLQIGAAYLFIKPDSAWMYLDADSGPGGRGYQFGFSVAIGGSGDPLVIGTPRLNSNRRLRNGFVSTYRLVDDGLGSSRSDASMNLGTDHEFGNALAINDGGGRLAVSEHQNSMEEANSGAVYIYRIINGNELVFQDSAKAPNIGDGDLFGSSIAMSKDGQYVAVGARLEDGDNTGIYIGEDFDTAVGNNNSGNNVGAVYVYEIASDGAFTLLSVVKPSIITRDNLNYGISVSLGGIDEERSLVIGGTGMVEVIPFSELLPIGLSVSAETLTVTRLEMSSVRVSVDRAATVSVEVEGVEGKISLVDGETSYDLDDDDTVDILFNADAIGPGTLTFTARAPTEKEEIAQVFVTVAPSSLEIQADRPTVYIASGSSETVTTTITDIPEAVTLTIQSDAPEVATVTNTVIAGLRDSIDLEIFGLSAGISTFTLTARHPNYNRASTQIIVHVLPPIGLAVTPPVLNLYRLNTSSIRVSVDTPAVITVTATNTISLTETEYSLETAGTVDIPVTGIAEGRATITLTAQDPLERTEMIQVPVAVFQSLEVLVNTSQIALVTGGEVQVEVALNRIATEIGPVTVTLTLTGGGGEISLSTSTLLFERPDAQVVIITGSSFAPYNEIVFDADNENYVDAIVSVKGASDRLTGDADADDDFGHQIAISADGQTLVVGEPSGEDGGPNNSGLVHVYTKDTLGLWSLRQTLKASNAGGGDEFGCSVAIDNDGETIAVGACGEDSNARGVGTTASNNNSVMDSGAAYVFTYNVTEWIQEAYFKVPAPTFRGKFGHSVALNGDGTTLAVSQPFDNTGNVHLFTESDSTWMSRGRENGPGPTGQEFGISVALNGSGNRLVVGAPQLMSGGTVYTYDFNGSSLRNRVSISPANPVVNYEFGHAVAVDEVGGRLAMSEQRNGTTAVNSGAVYIYTVGVGFQSSAKALNAGDGDLFGSSIAMSKDGRYLAVGALSEDSTAIGVHISDDFDNDLGINVGAVYVYEIASDGALTPLSVVKPSIITRDDLNYGISVSLGGVGDERSLVIGADGMVEIISFSELRPLGLRVSAETLTVTRLDTNSVRVSVDNAATVSVEADERISLVDGETSYELGSDGTVDVFFNGNAVGTGTLTFTARTQNGEEETIQVFVTVLPSLFEIQADRPTVYIESGLTATVKVTITDIPEAVTLMIQSEAPDVATVTNTVIKGFQGSTNLEITGLRAGVSTFTFIAEHPEYVTTSTQIIVNVSLSDIGFSVEPRQIRMMELYTQDVTVDVNVREGIRTTVGVVVNQAIETVNLSAAGVNVGTGTEYVLNGSESIDVTVVGVNAGTATITVTAQAEHYATTSAEVQVTIDDYIEPEIIVSATELTVDEEVSEIVQVSLTVPPVRGSAMIGVEVSNNLLSVSTDTLIFSSDNYQTSQALTLMASNDYLNVDILADVYLTQIDPSGNANHDYGDTTIRISVIDDENNEIGVTSGGIRLTEISLTEGDSITLDVSLALPASGTTELAVEFDPASDRISLTNPTVPLQFTSTQVSIEIVAPSDDLSNIPRVQSGTLTLSGSGYQARTIPWSVSDDENGIIQLSNNNLTLAEGENTMINVSINRIDPDATVIVMLSDNANVEVTLMDGTEISQLTFTNTEPQSVIVTALPDLDPTVAQRAESVTFSAGGYDDTVLAATVTNSEVGTIGIVPAGEITLEEGMGATVMVSVHGVLPVTIDVSVTDGLSTNLPDGTLDFTLTEPGPHEVTVTPVDDNFSTGNRSGTVTFSVTAGGYTPVELTVQIIENDGLLFRIKVFLEGAQ